MFADEGSYARKQLEKLGWTNGDGLGADRQGISEPIKVFIKKDTTGVGHSVAKEFTHHWWDVAFNKAAANITVEEGEDGVVVKKKERSRKERSKEAKKSLYSNFIKGSLLSNGTEETVEKEPEDKDSADEDIELRTQTLKLPEDELFKRCGGRTAHKGARHGLKLNGKLARIQQQEQVLLDKYRSASQLSAGSEVKVTGGRSPHNPAHLDAGEDSAGSARSGNPCASTSEQGSGVEPLPKVKKRKKSKKRQQEEDEESNGLALPKPDAGDVRDKEGSEKEEDEPVRKKRRKGGKRETESGLVDGGGSVSGHDVSCPSSPSSANEATEETHNKRKKRKEDVEGTTPEDSDGSRAKSKKKKRKEKLHREEEETSTPEEKECEEKPTGKKKRKGKKEKKNRTDEATECSSTERGVSPKEDCDTVQRTPLENSDSKEKKKKEKKRKKSKIQDDE